MKKFLAVFVIIVISLTMFGSINSLVLANWVKNGVKMQPLNYSDGVAYKAMFKYGKSEMMLVADVESDYIAFVIEADVDKSSLSDLLVYTFKSSGLTGELGSKILAQFSTLENPTGFYFESNYYVVRTSVEGTQLWISIY